METTHDRGWRRPACQPFIVGRGVNFRPEYLLHIHVKDIDTFFDEGVQDTLPPVVHITIGDHGLQSSLEGSDEALVNTDDAHILAVRLSVGKLVSRLAYTSTVYAKPKISVLNPG